MSAVHLIIHGRVQGVGYRAWTGSRARELGLSGWVRNRTDGTVEAILSGDESIVQAMLTDCHEGPPAARVSNIESTAWTGEVPIGFRTLTTA